MLGPLCERLHWRYACAAASLGRTEKALATPGLEGDAVRKFSVGSGRSRIELQKFSSPKPLIWVRQWSAIRFPE